MSYPPTIPSDEIKRLARLQAHVLRHNYVGTEHLLLVLTMLTERDFPGVQDLAKLGLTYDAVRGALHEILDAGLAAYECPLREDVRYSTALRLSRSEGITPTQTAAQQIFKGLLREGEGLACQIIVSLRVARNPQELLVTLE